MSLLMLAKIQMSNVSSHPDCQNIWERIALFSESLQVSAVFGERHSGVALGKEKNAEPERDSHL